MQKAAGDHAAALENYRQAVAILSASLGPDHPTVSHPMYGLAGLQERTGDLSGAEETCRRVLTIRRKAHADDAPILATTRIKVGRFLVGRKKFREAEPVLLRGREVREAERGKSDSWVVSATKALLEIYEAEGRDEEAGRCRELLKEGEATVAEQE